VMLGTPPVSDSLGKEKSILPTNRSMPIPTCVTSEADSKPLISQSNGINKVDGVPVILDELPAMDGNEVSHLGPQASSPDDDGNHFDSKNHRSSNKEVVEFLALAVDVKGNYSNIGDSKDNFPPISPLISLILSSVFPTSFSKKEELENDAVSDEYLGTISDNSVIREYVERDILDTPSLHVDVDKSPGEEEGKESPEEFLIKLFSKKEVLYVYLQFIWIDMYAFLQMNMWVYIHDCMFIYVYITV
jgi:hypothetical protein